MSPTERARTAGIIPRFGAELFERASNFQGRRRLVSASYAQLYNMTGISMGNCHATTACARCLSVL